MKFILPFLFCCTILLNCTNTSEQKPTTTSTFNRSGKLIHTVFFKLKPEADKEKMIKSLESLGNIEVVKKVEVGTFQDTGNPTSLAEYTLMVQLTFDDLAGFKVYETHPIHLASRNDTKDLLGGIPIGYDYFIK